MLPFKSMESRFDAAASAGGGGVEGEVEGVEVEGGSFTVPPLWGSSTGQKSIGELGHQVQLPWLQASSRAQEPSQVGGVVLGLFDGGRLIEPQQPVG